MMLWDVFGFTVSYLLQPQNEEANAP